MLTAFRYFIAAALGIAPLAHAGEGVWTGNGPDGGAIAGLLIDPVTPATLYASTVGGLFKSVDSGASWTRAQNGLGSFIAYGDSQALLLDASASATLFAVNADGGLSVSHDGATSWLPTGYQPAMGDAIKAIAKSPGAAGTVYLGTYGSGVLVSHDGGASFGSTGTGLPAGTAIAALATHPSTAGVVLAYIDLSGIYRSTDSGLHWSLAQQTSGSSQYNNFSFGAGNSVYFAATSLYRSGDGGATWSTTASSGVGPVAAHPSVANLVYFVDSANHARMSSDGGASSSDISAGSIMANDTDNASISALALAPTTTGVQYVYAGTGEAGVFRRDSGGTWTSTNQGLRANDIRAIAPHPSARGRLIAGVADATSPSPGIFLSTDAANSWAPSNAGVRAQDIRSLSYDPTSTATVGSSIVYATGRGSTVGGVNVNGGLYKSSNGGASWSNIDNGLPAFFASSHYIGLVRSLVLDPRSCASPPPGSAPCTSGPLQTLYADASGRSSTFRLIKSIDAGANWTNIDGLPPSIASGDDAEQDVLPIALVIDPLNPQHLYTGTFANFAPAFVATPSISSGVFRSDDGGATWNLRSTGLPFYPGSTTTHLDVMSLALNPQNPDVLWASSYNEATAPLGYSHIYKSVDGGANWSDSSSGISAGDIRQIVVDPANPANVYAAASGSVANPAGVYKSSDGGVTWRSISAGMQNAGPSSIAIDPFDPTVLYAGTPSGVWSLHQLPDSDGDGVPDVVEQAGPNGGDANGDGIPDYLQANVASVAAGSGTAGHWTPDTSATPNAPDSGSYFTISVIPGTAGTCAQAVDAQAIDPSLLPADVDAGVPELHSLSLVRFELLACPSADIVIHFSNASFNSGWSFRYYGPSTPGDDTSIAWHALGSGATRMDAQTWKLHLASGRFGSYRPASSNSILFEGGPAYSERIFANGFD